MYQCSIIYRSWFVLQCNMKVKLDPNKQLTIRLTNASHPYLWFIFSLTIVFICSMEYYMQKTYYKTASLISNSCKAIALLAEHSAEVAMLAFEYGKNLVGILLNFKSLWCYTSITKSMLYSEILCIENK